jgi:predicted nucleic acid-binding protein
VTATLVDSNVILDVVGEDEEWFDWSAAMLADAAERGLIAINPIIYAEVSTRLSTIEIVEAALPADYFVRLSLPWEAAFLAATCYLRYRQTGGAKRSPLPDFLIGAHAATAGLGLLTRDARRCRQCFPRLRIIAP